MASGNGISGLATAMWPNGGNLARVGRTFELDQVQANSIQLKSSAWQNSLGCRPLSGNQASGEANR